MQWLDFKQDFKTTDITDSSKWKLSESIFTSFLMWNGKVVGLDVHLNRLESHLMKIYSVHLSHELKFKIKNLLKENSILADKCHVRIEFFRKNILNWPTKIEDLICFVSIESFHHIDRPICLNEELVPYTFNKISDVKTSQYMLASYFKQSSNIDFLYCCDDEILEASTSAILLNLDDQLVASDNQQILNSISIMQLSQKKNICFKKLTIDDFKMAKEIILLNSVRGVISVEKFGDQKLDYFQSMDSKTQILKKVYASLFMEI